MVLLMIGPQNAVGARVSRTTLFRLPLALALAAVAAIPSYAQKNQPVALPPQVVAPSTTGSSAAYYHYGLAHIYEELATTQGRSDYATQAVEQYKLALNADPDSSYLQDGLADLYFKLGRIREAVDVAQEQIKKNPSDLDAHRLLARIYYRSLGDAQSGTQAQMVQLATAEYETLVKLEPNVAENHLLLGQLYEVNHDSAKAEAQFKAAQGLDNGSEESMLNLARLYSEQGDMQRVISTLTAVPVAERSVRMELAIGASYDQLHKPKDAAGAYRRALEIEGDNLDARRGLANAQLNSDQLDDALKSYNAITAAEPQDAQSYIKISEIQRRQGHYDVALATLKKAKTLVPDSEELVFNEALIYDALGRYADAEQSLKGVLASSSKPDGKYTDGERNNRAIFLDRLALLYREQNKTAEAVDTYKQMAALGGDLKSRGIGGEVDAYRDAHEWDKAAAVAAAAAKDAPNDRDAQVLYAGQLADTGKADEGIALLRKQLNGKAEDRVTYLTLAQAYIRLRRWSDARAALDKAEVFSQKSDDKVYLYFLRGTVDDKENKKDEAEVWLRKVLDIDPNNAQTLNYLAYMYAERGIKLPDALAMVKKAVELDPQNYAYLDTEGWVYFKSGEYALSQTLLEKAVERNATDPTVHDHLGQALEKQGKLKPAVAQWERALVEYNRSLPADIEPDDVAKLHKHLDSARVKLAKNGQSSKVTP
ncbi:MAG: tetratricopeptide repeat protein [Janthinobacterium lividum]